MTVLVLTENHHQTVTQSYGCSQWETVAIHVSEIFLRDMLIIYGLMWYSILINLFSKQISTEKHRFHISLPTETYKYLTCFGGSCGPCLMSGLVLLSGWFLTTVTGCLNMEAVWRIGRARLASWRIPRQEIKQTIRRERQHEGKTQQRFVLETCQHVFYTQHSG